MNNWEQLIVRLIVPMTFFGIWAVTHLFNRESKGFTPRPPGPGLGQGQGQGTASGVRPGDPTLRWGATNPQASASGRRVSVGDEDILILTNDPSRSPRGVQGKPNPVPARRGIKGRMATAVVSKPQEPAPSRPKLGGVSQNVNQHLARPMDMTPLTTIAPMATSTGSDLANAPTAPSKTSTVLTISTLIPLMNDPMRLREAFIVNELFQKPLALRERRGFRP